MRHWFKTPVAIWVGSNTKRVVTSVEEAARLILEDKGWSAIDTMAARTALLAAMEGGSIDDAHREFVQAAKKAGFLAD
ncbi:DUF982 domain-containing protein [Limoniibacter endophyticus]|uniref:DUF982 domain-containing protein n=1 Tax=Limoniibacter endophyticus TaxID=1565040 RepID=A0A8J3DEP8_9HYPH|nr:DUF982 domain-containing protein [Limoniibacter endophyticus]GHC61451.1 hypothetical protein GCM10010136_01990 [Limoniibacter endophyticus]